MDKKRFSALTQPHDERTQNLLFGPLAHTKQRANDCHTTAKLYNKIMTATTYVTAHPAQALPFSHIQQKAGIAELDGQSNAKLLPSRSSDRKADILVREITASSAAELKHVWGLTKAHTRTDCACGCRGNDGREWRIKFPCATSTISAHKGLCLRRKLVGLPFTRTENMHVATAKKNRLPNYL